MPQYENPASSDGFSHSAFSRGRFSHQHVCIHPGNCLPPCKSPSEDTADGSSCRRLICVLPLIWFCSTCPRDSCGPKYSDYHSILLTKVRNLWLVVSVPVRIAWVYWRCKQTLRELVGGGEGYQKANCRDFVAKIIKYKGNKLSRFCGMNRHLNK